MASREHAAEYGRSIARERELVRAEPARHAYNLLHFGYTVLPILAGVDKFFHKLVNWDQYLSPFVNRLVKGHGHEFMLAAGVVEVVAGLGVLIKPRIFAPIVALWLLGIVVNLVLGLNYFDVALRDFGLFIGALALSHLSRDFDGDHRARDRTRVEYERP